MEKVDRLTYYLNLYHCYEPGTRSSLSDLELVQRIWSLDGSGYGSGDLHRTLEQCRGRTTLQSLSDVLDLPAV